jgi:hypothetical protein
MKTIKKVKIETVFCIFIPKIEEMEQGVVYVTNTYKTSSHLCLCGCGNLSVTPLNTDGWTMKEKVDGTITLTPSILNNNCPNKSHYIITDNIANFV